MNDTTNSQGSATGGNTSTGNPQNIGSQSIFSQNQSLQSSTGSLLNTNSSSLTLTDPNGQPIDLTTPVRASVTAPKPASNHHNASVIIGVAGLIIVVMVAVTWFMTKSSKSFN